MMTLCRDTFLEAACDIASASSGSQYRPGGERYVLSRRRNGAASALRLACSGFSRARGRWIP